MKSVKESLYEIIFEADTRTGKLFDVLLLFVIILSVILVLLESVSSIRSEFKNVLITLEWIITIIFTLEYLLRILVVKKPLRYIFSFYGIIDLLSVIPTYLSLIIAGSQSLIVIRILRLLRVFRILKLTRYSRAGRFIALALWDSRAKISVFLFFVMIIVIITGTLIYLIEGEANGFRNIPVSIYWAIVTLTTVGYGDISPQTPAGQFLASLLMIMGYAIIAVPTGIITARIIQPETHGNTQVCPNCMHDKHEDDAVFCKKCGARINEAGPNSK
ncbi:MAG: ion transporter [Bacteroidetes bacterium]|nr:MAG: ion transporter [Bacteroidota bacterium]